MDASLGLLLKGDGKGALEPLPPTVSGLFLQGDMKSLAGLYDRNGHAMILAAANSDSLQVLSPPPSGGRIYYARPLDAYAEITYRDGSRARWEFNYGAGYLSQSARAIGIHEQMAALEIVDSKGNRRKVLP
jgi:hypothetical protein